MPVREYSHQPKMIMWVFHATFEKQIITHEKLTNKIHQVFDN